MSLDLSINDENYNYTYNVAHMWYKVYPDDEGMVQIEGMKGKDAYWKVLGAFEYILKKPMKEPENNWGSQEGFLKYLVDIMIASRNNPEEIWEAGR